MTIREKAKGLLVKRGMFPHQADAVIAIAISDPANAAMLSRWDDDTEGHPKQLLAALWEGVRRTALEYIDKQCPLVWYRPMFTENPDAEIARLESGK